MSSDAGFKRLMREYEALHAQIVQRREETKRLNKRYTELKKHVMTYLQQRHQRNPTQQHLIFKGHDEERYKLRVAESVAKIRIGQKMLQSNMALYQRHHPHHAQVVANFYAFLQDQCKQGGRRTKKLSRTKLRRRLKPKPQRRRSDPTGYRHRQQQQPRQRIAHYRGDGDDNDDEEMTPDIMRMLRRVQSSRRLSITDQHSL